MSTTGERHPGAAHAADRTARARAPGRAFWIGLAIGGAVTVFGVVGLLGAGLANAVDVGIWVVGADLAHDLVLAPIAVVASVVLTRFVPLPWRAPIRSALVATSVLVIVAYPALRGFGRDTVPDNPTVQPLDYTTAVLTALGVVWALAAVWLGLLAVRRRQASTTRRSRD